MDRNHVHDDLHDRRRRGRDLSVYYVGHEGYICMDGRLDADLAVHPAEPVAVPRLMIASALWWTHVDHVYDRVRAASSGNLGRPAGKRRTASTDVHVTAYATKSGAEVRIDGPYGSGKSVLAAQLQELWGDAVTDHYRHRNGGECLRLSIINVQPPIFDVAENNGLPEPFHVAECLTCDGFGVMPADGAVCRSCDGAGAK